MGGFSFVDGSEAEMPIYAYRCQACGFEKDVLQKLSDAPLTDCPSCGQASFAKQVTAAGFQLKGSGWYVTDFRGGNTGAPAEKPVEGDAGVKADKADAKPADTQPAAGNSAAAAPPTPATPAAASPAPATGKVPAPSSGTA